MIPSCIGDKKPTFLSEKGCLHERGGGGRWEEEEEEERISVSGGSGLELRNVLCQ